MHVADIAANIPPVHIAFGLRLETLPLPSPPHLSPNTFTERPMYPCLVDGPYNRAN